MMPAPSPWRFDVEIPPDGRIEVSVPLPAGAQVTVLVTEKLPGEFDDLASAAASSADFWDNPFDDEDWNAR